MVVAIIVIVVVVVVVVIAFFAGPDDSFVKLEHLKRLQEGFDRRKAAVALVLEAKLDRTAAIINGANDIVTNAAIFLFEAARVVALVSIFI